MVEIELSYIPDSDEDVRSLLAQLEIFKSRKGIKVNPNPMDWDNAWAELMTYASHGKGPDVSHVGGTWVSSLAMMNALRPFRAAEVEAMGGARAFIPATWETTRQFNDPRVWAIPWTGYIYAICYRKDLLAMAGVHETNMLNDFRTLNESLQKLRENAHAEIAWLNPYIPAPFTDLVHIAASWIWSTGGDFINADGTKVTFTSMEAIRGLCNWMETYRTLPVEHKGYDWQEVVDLFHAGRAAAVLTDIRTANTFISQETSALIRDNLGVMPTTDIPWTGGGNFVIWQHVLGYPEREQASVELVKFLSSKESNLTMAREAGSMPARLDALEELYSPVHPLYKTVMQAARNGRAYHTVPLWRRIEYQIAQELGACLRDAVDKPGEASETILRARMEPLARRLNLTLGN